MRTDPGLGRRIQLRQGLVWLAATQGDPYAALLRGLDSEPHGHWRALAAEPLSRSATGDWVTARHAVAHAVRSEPALRGQPLLEGLDGIDEGSASRTETEVAGHAARAWDRVTARAADAAGVLDVVAVARRAAVGTLARAWGLDDAGERAAHSAVELTAGALDAPFYPQSLAVTRRIAGGAAALRALAPVGSRGLAFAMAGVPMATGLVAEAVVHCSALAAGPDGAGVWERLRQEPEYGARVVMETLRLAAPAQLHAAVADAPCDLAGLRIDAGDRVVVLVGAANRDPEAFTDPDRFDPGRAREESAPVLLPGLIRTPVLAFAVECAREGLCRLAARRPGPVTGPVRRTAAPVSRSLVSCPARTTGHLSGPNEPSQEIET
nr:cytochrome P450 [Streptomyces sp. SID2888]